MTDQANPPAFPNIGNSNWNLQPTDGMTLRDYFAGQAITVCLKDMSLPVSEWAREAYQIADAMLAEREQGK